MIDFTSKVGVRAAERLGDTFVIWLTTSGPQGVPQPRPVWFVRDGDDLLIYSQPNTKKLQHIARNPSVALHFDGGEKGLDIQVFGATAEIATDLPPAHQHSGYMAKYGAEIERLGGTKEAFGEAYSVPIRVTLKRLRGRAPS